jgi:hypothetical protein
LIDREAQRTISFTGIDGVFPQDSAVTEGMGDISDRAPRAETRRRRLDATRAWRDDGTVTPLVDDPGISTRLRSGYLIAPEDQPWPDASEQTMR